MFGLSAGSGTRCAGGCGIAIREWTLKIGPDVHELAGGEHAPAALAVEPLRGDDHRSRAVQLGDVHGRRRAADVQAWFPRARVGRALEDVQGVLARVAQRP